MEEQQLNLIPEKVINPKFRKVILEELPESLTGPDPDKSFVDSVRQFGILQPIVLIESSKSFKVAFGRRRIKAARAVEMMSIPALIYPAGWTVGEVLALVENLQRKDNLATKIEAVEQLRKTATPEEICGAVGFTKAQLKQTIKLIDGLIPPTKKALMEGRIATSTANKMLKLPPAQQESLASKEKIKGTDVDELLRQETQAKAAELPDELFEDLPQLGLTH